MIEGLCEFAGVRAALAHRAADTRFARAGKRNVAARDDDDTLIASGVGRPISPAVFHLTYEDKAGTESQRVVTIKRIERRGETYYLHSFCHLRHGPRCFSVERISEVFDATTGEVHTAPDKFFADHPIFHSPEDPEGVAMKTCRNEINLLTVVGAADGRFDPDEQDVLLVHVFNRCDHLSMDEDRLRRALARVTPVRDCFEGSLLQMKRFRIGDSEALKRTLRKMVDSDGQIAPEEVRFVNEIERYLA